MKHEHFYLLKWREATLVDECVARHKQNSQWNKNVPHLCRNEMEINCDGVVIQSPVTFHFQRNILRTYGTNVRENSVGGHINFLCARFKAYSIYLPLFIMSYSYPPLHLVLQGRVPLQTLTNWTLVHTNSLDALNPLSYWKIVHDRGRICSAN